MPLLVSESKSNQDPSQTYLTQALLSGVPLEGEEENETVLSSAVLLDYHRKSVPQIERHVQIGADRAYSADVTEMNTLNFSSPPEFTMKSLGWLTCPVAQCLEDTELPTISVFSDPEVTEELEMIIHSNGEGTAQTTGQRRVQLRSQGSNKPSVAIFEGIHIKRAGLYVVEVHSVRNPELSLVADHPITIVPKFEMESGFGETTLPEELGMAKVQMWGA